MNLMSLIRTFSVGSFEHTQTHAHCLSASWNSEPQEGPYVVASFAVPHVRSSTFLWAGSTLG